MQTRAIRSTSPTENDGRPYRVRVYEPVIDWLHYAVGGTAWATSAFTTVALQRVLQLSRDECWRLGGFFCDHRRRRGDARTCDEERWVQTSLRLDLATRVAWVREGRDRFGGFTMPAAIGVSTALFWALAERMPEQIHHRFPRVPAPDDADTLLTDGDAIVARIGPAGALAVDQLRGDTEWRRTWFEDCRDTFARTRSASSIPCIGDGHVR